MNVARNIQAAILTGGKSSRMGRDKALITFNGRPLIEHIFHQLNGISGIDGVFAVGDRPAYYGRGIEIVPDIYPGAGPLGGIASALHHADSQFVLVVATDMPFLSAPLIEAMIDVVRNYDVLVPVRSDARGGQQGGQSYETLHAIYNRGVRENIENKLAIGDNRVVSFFNDVNVRKLDEDWVSQFNPDFTSFINVNQPGELQEIQRRESAEIGDKTAEQER